MSATAVVNAVATSRGDLGLVPAAYVASAGAWWTALEPAGAPKIIARLPFVERDDHPADLPVFVISRVSTDAMVKEAEVWSLRVSGWGPKATAAVAQAGETVVSPEGALDGAALLVSVPQGGSIDSIKQALVAAGATVRSAALVGSHATRYTVAAQKG
jgi:hypothetical protein